MKKTQSCAALAALLLTAGLQTAHADFTVKVGYADSLRANGFFPNPWEGSPNTTFWGRIANTGEYDSGAIQIINNGNTPMMLTSALVDGLTNGASYRIWDGQIGAGYAIPAKGAVIMAQDNDAENFDTSDNGPGSPLSYDSMGNPHGDATTPHVKLTLDGTAYDLVDTGQVLNTSGFDFANYKGSNESFAWRPIGTFGGQAGDTPEPGAFALLGAGGLAGAFFFRQRRRA